MDNIHCSKVMQDVWFQKKKQRFCDVILRTDDGTIWAHKSVLCANSTFFDSVLLCNNAECAMQEFVLPGCKQAFVDPIIDFMYTGKVELSTEKLTDTFSFAEKYNIPGLKCVCIDFTKRSINGSSWVTLLKMAMYLDLPDIKAEIADFVVPVVGDIIDSASECKDFYFLSAEHISCIISSRVKNRNTAEGEMLAFKLIVAWTSHYFLERQHNLGKLFESLCITQLNFADTQQFLTSSSTVVADEMKVHEQILALLKLLESNQPQTENRKDAMWTIEDEPFETMDNDDDDDLSEDNYTLSELTQQRASNVGKNKRKSTTPMRLRGMENEEAKLKKPPSTERKTILKLKTKVLMPAKRRGRPPKGERKKATGRKIGRPLKIPPPDEREEVKKRLEESKIEDLYNEATEDEEDYVEDKKDTDYTAVKIKTEKKKRERKPGRKRTRRPAEKMILQCPQCPQVETNRLSFRLHMRTHGNSTPFACDSCGFQTVHYGMYLAHKRRKHKEGEERIQCVKCPKTFASESAYSHHLRGHGSDTPLLCDMCGFTTRHHATMALHKRKHLGNTFKCHYEGCAYETVRKNRYLDHLNKHEGVKNHVCSVCGKAFAARKHLLRHEDIHKGKHIRCEICDYNTHRHDKLRQHYKTRHPNEALMKGYCNQSDAIKQIAVLAALAARQSSEKSPKKQSKAKSQVGALTATETPSHEETTEAARMIDLQQIAVITKTEPGLVVQSPPPGMEQTPPATHAVVQSPLPTMVPVPPLRLVVPTPPQGMVQQTTSSSPPQRPVVQSPPPGMVQTPPLRLVVPSPPPGMVQTSTPPPRAVVQSPLPTMVQTPPPGPVQSPPIQSPHPPPHPQQPPAHGQQPQHIVMPPNCHGQTVHIQSGMPVVSTINEEMLHYLQSHHPGWPAFHTTQTGGM